MRQKFSRLSEAEIRERIFVRPYIRNILEDKHFDSTLADIEKILGMSFAWWSLISWEMKELTITVLLLKICRIKK